MGTVSNINVKARKQASNKIIRVEEAPTADMSETVRLFVERVYGYKHGSKQMCDYCKYSPAVKQITTSSSNNAGQATVIVNYCNECTEDAIKQFKVHVALGSTIVWTVEDI